MNPFHRLESEVRSYCRSFPVVFETAKGAEMTDENGETYIDFFAGAGALNYGHNHPELQKALVEYLTSDGITHSLDMFTVAKRRFLERFDEVILQPRGMSYRMMFPGPTGTNAVESALKIARKATGRTTVASFTNGFHGMTLGSLAITGNAGKRGGAGVPLGNTDVLPFDGYFGQDIDTVQHIEHLLTDNSSGIDKPAAFVVETVQAEGGVRVSSFEWLKRLAALGKEHGIPLIIDDIQVGCGRTGPFFSFEPAGIQPDMICLSKSLSAYGLPMAMVLIKPEHDVFTPGEHNGTFRGHMPAFVTATKALDFWEDDALTRKVQADADYISKRLHGMAEGTHLEVRGRGFIQGLVFEDPDKASAVSKAAFERGLIIETAGPRGEVVKVLPPLIIDCVLLERGLDILEQAVAEVLDDTQPMVVPAASSQEARA